MSFSEELEDLPQEVWEIVSSLVSGILSLAARAADWNRDSNSLRGI